jgi:hypothetical protein
MASCLKLRTNHILLPIPQSKWLLVCNPVFWIPIGLVVHDISIPVIFLSLYFYHPVFQTGPYLFCSREHDHMVKLLIANMFP